MFRADNLQFRVPDEYEVFAIRVALLSCQMFLSPPFQTRANDNFYLSIYLQVLARLMKSKNHPGSRLLESASSV